MQKQEGFEGEKSVILNDQKVLQCQNHEFCADLHITDIGYYPHANYHGKERPTGCDQYVLIYCDKGKGSYELNGLTFKVNQNQFFILPVGKSHKYAADLDEPWSIYWVHFNGRKADFFYNQLYKSDDGPKNVISNASRKIIFDDILHHLELSNNFDNIIYGNCFLYSYLASFQTSELKISLNENDIIQQCIQLMKQNLDKNLKLADFSRILNISASHLSATFKSRMQYSPIHLYTTYKIQKACQLLVGEPKPIKNIAFELGFEDQYHFSRVFKNEMGLSPKLFRNKQMM
jgi:AraC family transcriptional regulator, arabinose operon regulatory protein